MKHWMKITVLQPNFFPFKSYFDLIGKVDKVIFADDSFYNAKSWVNRTALKRGDKKFIFKVGVNSKGDSDPISELEINAKNWKKNFLRMIASEYKDSINFEKVFPVIKEVVYLPTDNMSHISAYSIFRISQEFFRHKTQFSLASKRHKNIRGSFRNKIIEICKRERAKEFYTFSMYKESFLSDYFIKNDISISYFSSPNGSIYSCIDFLMNDLDLVQKTV